MSTPSPYAFSRAQVEIIKRCWADDNGRLALSIVVEQLAGIHGDPFSTDALEMARGCGRRSVGIDLMRAINLPIAAVVQEPHEPRSNRPITATERAATAAVGEPAAGGPASRQRRG